MRYFLDRRGDAAYFLDDKLVLRSFQIQRGLTHTGLSAFIKEVNSAEMAAIILACSEVDSKAFSEWMNGYWNLHCSFFENNISLDIK